MSKQTLGRLATAQERLRRIEKTIGPYLDKGPAEAQGLKSGRWIPADSVQVKGREVKQTQAREIAATSK